MNIRRREPAYCFGIFGLAKAPWRPTQREALEDAVDAGYGTRDEHTGTIYLTVPGEIWTSMELVPVVPRDLWTLPTAKAAPIDPAATEGLTRIERIIARREAGTYRVR